MRIEIVGIGTELLLGFTVDTNGADLGRAFAAAGIRVVRRSTVADDPDAMRDAIVAALRRTGVVVTTGGLGPTRNDLTRDLLADLFGAPLEFDAAVWETLLERYRRLGRTPAASNRVQALVPRGAIALPNRWGTAPGLWLSGRLLPELDAEGLVIALPGVPVEMRNLLAHEVIPRLAARSPAERGVIRSRTVRTAGIAESSLAERVMGTEERVAPLTLAYLPGLEGVDLRLTAWNLPPSEADQRLAEAARELRTAAGAYAYGEEDDDLAAVVLARAREAGLRLATAESCTGGLVGGRLTAVPGSSDSYVGGVVCYADTAKERLLGVPPELLALHGAVSEPVARSMAEATLDRLPADLAVSVTGIAGPGGGTEEKPVGTVWFAVAGRSRETVATRRVFAGSRVEVRARAAQSALGLLLRALAPAPNERG